MKDVYGLQKEESFQVGKKNNLVMDDRSGDDDISITIIRQRLWVVSVAHWHSAR